MNDLVARKTVLETNALCVAVNYIQLALDAFRRCRTRRWWPTPTSSKPRSTSISMPAGSRWNTPGPATT